MFPLDVAVWALVGLLASCLCFRLVVGVDCSGRFDWLLLGVGLC